MNTKVLVGTVVGVLLVGAGVHWAHGYQVRRNAGGVQQRAEKAQNAGDLEQAVYLYETYLSLKPNDAQAQEKLGILLDTNGKSPLRVAGIFLDLLKAAPAKDDLRYRLALNLIKLQRFSEAIVQLKILLPLWKDRAELEHILGWCQEASGDYAAAASSFTNAIALAPQRLASYPLLAGVLQDHLDQSEEAAKIMEDLVGNNPKSFHSYLLRCEFRRRHHWLDTAQADLTMAFALAPKETAVFLAAGELAAVKGDLQAARESVRRAWELNPHDVHVIKTLADLEAGAGRRAEALALLTESVRLLPHASDLQVDLSELRRDDDKLTKTSALLKAAAHGKQRNEVCKRLRELAAQRPTWLQIPLLQACLEEQEENYDRALEQRLRAFQLGERSPDGLKHLVQLLLWFDRSGEAQEILAKSAADVLLPPELVRLQAETALANKNVVQALQSAGEAVPSSSRDYRDFLWLGRTYHRAGEDAKAEEALRRASGLAPHSPEVWIALAEQLTRMNRRDAALALLPSLKVNLPGTAALYTEARCLEVMGLVAQTEEAYGRALAERPDDFILLSHAADFYSRTEQTQKAEPILVSLLASATAPGAYQARARRELGLIWAGKAGGNRTQALALIDANLRQSPRHAPDLRARALAQTAADAQKAISVFEQTARRHPLSSEERLQLARIYEANGDEVGAREQVIALLTNEPENVPTLVLYIEQLLKAEDLSQARTHLQRLVRLEPASRRTHNLIEKLAP